MTVRVGQGFDVHAFSDDPARKLVLGGVVFDGERGLVGHSDADVVAHACADALLGAAGLEPGNVDAAVVCERPKLAPRREEMSERLSGAVGAPVTVKGNRAEGLGAIGRGEGIACFAVAVVER